MSDSSRRPLRAAVVGLGMMGRNHVRVWDEAVEGVELVAVADPDPAAVARATGPIRHPARAASNGPTSTAVSFTAPMTTLTSSSVSDGWTGMLSTCSVSRSVAG